MSLSVKGRLNLKANLGCVNRPIAVITGVVALLTSLSGCSTIAQASSTPTSSTSARGSRTPPSQTRSQTAPLTSQASISQWRGHGEIASVTSGRITMVERTGIVRTIHVPGIASDPIWSSNGRWLAFLVTPRSTKSNPRSVTTTRLWVASSTAHTVRALSAPQENITGLQWDPGRPETLAFSSTTPTGSSSQLDTIDISSLSSHVVLKASFITGFQWSPTGRSLAVGTVTTSKAHALGRLVLVSQSGSISRTLLHSTSGGYQPASWAPNQRELLFWSDPYFSSSIAADGLVLSGLNLQSERSKALGTTLTYGNWITWSPSGDSVAVVMGGSRTEWNTGRSVQLCHFPTATCSPVTLPSSLIGLDPTFSKQGALILTGAPGASPSQIAPPAIGPVSTPFGATTVDAWYQSQGLWYLKRAGKTPVKLVGNGAHSATAIHSGILYVKADSLWFRPTSSSQALLLASSIGPPSPYRDTYYGYLDWTAQYSWHS